MTIFPGEARDALRDIETSDRRSREFKSYRFASNYFIVWGLAWIVCFSATGISESYEKFWLYAASLGMSISALLAWQMRGHLPGEGHRHPWRIFRTSMVYVAFLFAAYGILQPQTLNQKNAFSALLMGLIYAVYGITLARPRYLWLGLTMMAGTTVGYFLFAPWFSFWMAAIGGGGLVLTGLWMRRA